MNDIRVTLDTPRALTTPPLKCVGSQDSPGGPVAKNPPASAGNMGGPGRPHAPRGRSARAPQGRSLRPRAREPRLLKPNRPRAHAPQREKPPQWEAPTLQLESSPRSPQLAKSLCAARKTQDSQKSIFLKIWHPALTSQTSFYR